MLDYREVSLSIFLVHFFGAFYEKMHLLDSRTIYYISFSLPATPIILSGRFEKNKESVED